MPVFRPLFALCLALAALAAVRPGAAQPALQTQESPFQTRALNLAVPADQAFALSALVELPDTLVLMWEIMDGYYLYRQSLEFGEAPGADRLGEPELPDGVAHSDEFFGDVEVYYDRLIVRLPITDVAAEKIDLTVNYQGCAEIGYCYPVQRKEISVEIPR